MRLRIIAIGRLRNGPEKDLIEAGQNRRKHQSNIIGVMTGKI